MENLAMLTGKYGEEGDRLIFKVINNGLHDKQDADKEKLRTELDKMLEKPYTSVALTERALRYDLTIPFARYVVMHQQDIALPFRRYQMQPVWRADRPQRGRYREFWQCDCDVVGSTSLINEAELLCIYQQAFDVLRVPQVSVRINSRKILTGLAELAGASELLLDMTIALDKLDKIGWDGAAKEMEGKGIPTDSISAIRELIEFEGSNEEKIDMLRSKMAGTQTGLLGVDELEQTLAYHRALESWSWTAKVVIDISLARGLNYYTGIIAEVNTTAVQMGSIGGGGRYDDLTGLFGLKNVSGVGISFGIDRIYDVLTELNLFPDQQRADHVVMVCNFGGVNESYALQILSRLRAESIPSEIYPDAGKMDKQLKYANKRNLQYVLIPGDSERESEQISLKDLVSGEQQLLSMDDALEILRS